MMLNPIIPIWLMLIISIILTILLFFLNKNTKKKKILRLALIIILFIINLRPMIRTSEATVSQSDLNILFVIDTTLSMNAEDIEPTRLEQVKKDCEHIIEKMPNANYSIITFNNDAKLQVPFTSDTSLILNTITVLKTIDHSYANGTSMSKPKEKILNTLKNAQEKSENRNILFYFSDGEVSEDKKEKSYKDIESYVDNGAIIGYGTEEGGYMQYTDYYGKKNYVIYYDSNYRERKGVSKIDENNLKTIAKDIGIDYINSSNQNKINAKLSEIEKEGKYSTGRKNIESYDDIYYIFAIPLIIVFFLIYKEYKEEYSL